MKHTDGFHFERHAEGLLDRIVDAEAEQEAPDARDGDACAAVKTEGERKRDDPDHVLRGYGHAPADRAHSAMIGIRLNWNGGTGVHKLLRDGEGANQGAGGGGARVRAPTPASRTRRNLPDRQAKHVERKRIGLNRRYTSDVPTEAHSSTAIHAFSSLISPAAMGKNGLAHLVDFNVADLIDPDDVNVAANQRDHSSHGSGQQRPLPEGREPPGCPLIGRATPKSPTLRIVLRTVCGRELDQRGSQVDSTPTPVAAAATLRVSWPPLWPRPVGARRRHSRPRRRTRVAQRNTQTPGTRSTRLANAATSGRMTATSPQGNQQLQPGP